MRRKTGILVGCLTACVSLLLIAVVPTYSSETRTVTFDMPQTAAGTYKPPIIGANTHFGTVRVLGYNSAETARQHLNDIGATAFRDYMPWQSFAFPPSGPVLVKSRRLMDFLPKSKLTPLINLGLANSGVEGGIPPLSDAGLRSFESYVGKAVDETRAYDPIYEIWNEWNIYIGTGDPTPMLKGEGSPEDPRAAVHYTRVAKAAVAKIRQVNPDAKIVVGAVGDDIDWAWARAIVRDGVLNNTDGLSVHLYNQCERYARDRTAAQLIRRVEKLQTALKDIRGGVETPIYVTEFGWPTSKGNCGMPLDVSAYNFAQFILQSATIPWIKGIWMHELKNISPDPVDRESNYGLFTYDDKPKPAACFMAAAAEIVKSADAIDIQEPFPDVMVARAKIGERQKIILWTSSPEVKAHYTMPKGAIGSMMCGSGTLSAVEASELGPAPVVYDVEAGHKVTLNITN